MRYAYPIEITEAADGFTVTAPDVPEMVTCGATAAEALASAPDALVSALSFYIDEGKPVPHSVASHGQGVAVPVLVAAKMALHEAMLKQRISNVELGRRMGQGENAIRRLRDLLHRSHIDQVEAALALLGLQITAEVAPDHTLEWGASRSFAAA